MDIVLFTAWKKQLPSDGTFVTLCPCLLATSVIDGAGCVLRNLAGGIRDMRVVSCCEF